MSSLTDDPVSQGTPPPRRTDPTDEVDEFVDYGVPIYNGTYSTPIARMLRNSHKYALAWDGKVIFDKIISCSKAHALVKQIMAGTYKVPPPEEPFALDFDEDNDPPPAIRSGRWYHADIGSLFHYYVEKKVRKRPVAPFDIVRRAINQFDTFSDTVPADFFAHSEYTTGSRKYLLCGQLDLVHIARDGVWYVIDLKNSKELFTDKLLYEVKENYEFSPGVFFQKAYILKAHHATSRKWAIQLANYVRLLRLEGKRVSDIVMIANVHETFMSLRPVLIDIRQGSPSPQDESNWIFSTYKRYLEKTKPRMKAIQEEKIEPLPVKRKTTTNPELLSKKRKTE